MEIDKSIFKLDIFKDFLLKIFSKEFLIFLFFLVLSGGFWLMMTLNEDYERELTIDLRLTDVPKNVVITDDPDSVVRFTVRDKGFLIAAYEFTKELPPIYISFRQYNDGRGLGSIPASDIQRLIAQRLYKSSKITAIKTTNFGFSFNYGQHKQVPVRLLGTVAPGKNYNLAFVRFYPETVTVYADKTTLDSIREAYTERQAITNIVDAKEVEVDLRKIAKAKCVPGKVKMKLYPDVLTEESVTVPIEVINLPKDKVLRVFPSNVKVKFIVGAYRLRTMPRNAETKELLPVGFKVIADYNNVANGKANRCQLAVVSFPGGVHNVQLATNAVDYVIEQR